MKKSANNRWEKRPTVNTNDIYSVPSNGTIYSPFSFKIDPMEQLILVNFEKDPDEFYNIFEFQQACDKIGKKYFLVIAYRNDGASDVYYQAGFPFGSQESVLNSASFFVRPLEKAKFEVDSDSLDVSFVFEDKIGREIKVRVNERNRQNKEPFFLLAPIGAISKTPVSLPVYSLYEISFAKQKYTDIEIVIGKVKHKPDTFPMPIERSRNYFTRYSADTFNVDWNSNFNGPLSPLTHACNSKIEDNATTYEIEENSGHCEIRRMSTKNKKHMIAIDFHPAIPDFVSLRQEADINGTFSISTDHTAGSLHGNYKIRRVDNDIDFEIHPTGGWEPNESRLVLKIVFFVVKIFKEWPKSYVWNAKIRLDESGEPVMQSGWKRL